MPLFSCSDRDDRDISEIFTYIYADLTSVHPSNEYFKIFLQYFQPLFDLSLGIVWLKNKTDIIATNYLPKQDKALFRKAFKPYFEHASWLTKSEFLNLSDISYIKDAESCLVIPIVIHGCFQETSHKHKKPDTTGYFMLFSRLKKENFKSSANDVLDYICRQITSCFLQQSVRNYFLSSEKHKCLYDKQICNGNGIGPLNKAGKFLCLNE